MRYSLLSAATALLAFASTAFAQDATDGFDVFTAPMNNQQVVAGSSFDITWVPGDKPEYQNGTATIALLQGSDQQALQIGDTIAAGVKNSLGKYTWKVPAESKFKAYGLRITLDDDASTTAKENTIFQYSFPFQIVASAGSGTTTIVLGTGTAYTPEPTTTSTSVVVSSNSTTITSTSALAVTTSASNVTLITTGGTTSTSTRTRSSSTSTTSPTQTPNSAAGIKVFGSGLALVGGAVIALAL